MHITLPVLLLLIIVAVMLYRWAMKSADKIADDLHVVTLSKDEILEMIVILATWEEMNELRQLNNKPRTDVDNRHYDEKYAKSWAKTLDSVKAFQEKF